MNFDKVIQAYIDEAFELNKSNKSCHLALLLQGHKVISYGFNQMDRHCFRGKSITSMHAEIDCLRKCRPIKDLFRRNYTLVIVKVAKNANRLYSDSSPCKCCTSFIKGLGFKYVYCTRKDGTIEKVNLEEYIPYTRAPTMPPKKNDKCKNEKCVNERYLKKSYQ